MKKIYSAIVVFSFFLVGAPTYACSCATGDPPVEFNRAKAVFIGQMLGGSEKLSAEGSDRKSHPIEAGTVRFAVEEVFKGSLGSEITVEIDSMRNTSCGPYGLKRSERYIVYAYGGEKDTETLYSGVCTRTAPVDSTYARKDLDFLRNLPPAGSGGNLKGNVWADLRAGGVTPLPNIKIKIRGPDNQVFTVNADKEGAFEVKNLKAGKYIVEPELPANYSSRHKSAEIAIDDLGTAAVGFEAYIDGKVLGRVADRDGQGFNSIFLHLVSSGKSLYGHSTRKNGGFEASGVPPGEYVLYVELRHADSKKNTNFYYPGTYKREEAALIKVGLGETVEGIEFLLPDESKVRAVEGQVVWEDGQLATNVEVLLLCPRSAKPDGFAIEFSPTRTQTDAQGRFHLEGFTGEVYWIEARGSRKGSKTDEVIEVYSPSKRIVLSGNVKSIDLVLSEKGFGGRCGK